MSHPPLSSLPHHCWARVPWVQSQYHWQAAVATFICLILVDFYACFSLFRRSIARLCSGRYDCRRVHLCERADPASPCPRKSCAHPWPGALKASASGSCLRRIEESGWSWVCWVVSNASWRRAPMAKLLWECRSSLSRQALARLPVGPWLNLY